MESSSIERYVRIDKSFRGWLKPGREQFVVVYVYGSVGRRGTDQLSARSPAAQVANIKRKTDLCSTKPCEPMLSLRHISFSFKKKSRENFFSHLLK
jgi:hypothetical protein